MIPFYRNGFKISNFIYSDIHSVWVHYFDVKRTPPVMLGVLGYLVIQNLKSYSYPALFFY